MSIILVAVLAIGASPLDGTQSSANSSAPSVVSQTAERDSKAAEPAARSGKELADGAHAALSHWAKAKGQDLQTAGRELLGIYRELLQDKKLAVSQRESLRMSVRGRLMQLVPEIKRAADAPKSVALAKGQAALGQQGLGAGNGGAGGFGGGGAAGGQNNNNNGDAGQELVDLIQNTISPKSWDVNGGNGSIYYWRLQHAIVVRATDDVHADLSDALDQLNRAGN